MAQNKWTQATVFPEQWTDAANWSLGHVPLSTEDAFVGTNSGAAIVQSTLGETVNSVATSSNDDLDILGSTFTAAAGTGPNANSGTIALSDAVLSIGGGAQPLSITAVPGRSFSMVPVRPPILPLSS